MGIATSTSPPHDIINSSHTNQIRSTSPNEKQNDSMTTEKRIKTQTTAKQLSKEWSRTIKREMRHIHRQIRKSQLEGKKIKLEMKKEARRSYGDQQRISALKVMAKSYVQIQNTIKKMNQSKSVLNEVIIDLKEYRKYTLSPDTKTLLIFGIMKIYIPRTQIPSVIIDEIALFYEHEFFREHSVKINTALDQFHEQLSQFRSKNLENIRVEMESVGLVTVYYPILREPLDLINEDDFINDEIERIMEELSVVTPPPPIIYSTRICNGCNEKTYECCCGDTIDDYEDMKRRLAALQ